MRTAKTIRAQGDMIELLATLIEQYEIRQGHTAPILSPRDRLAGLIEEGGLTRIIHERRRVFANSFQVFALCR